MNDIIIPIHDSIESTTEWLKECNDYDDSKLKEFVKTKTDTEIAEMITNGDIDENEISFYLGYKRICSVGKILYGKSNLIF